MRLRFGVVLAVLAVLWGVGCRKPLTPNIDRNIAPETWITAAPMDTLTAKDPQLRPLPSDPTVHVIPVRFHMYWAGSDPDGAVVGFYWAVTETTVTPEPDTNLPPPLPGPKPQDYHYTTRTDTTFIFNVTEGAPDRQHAFFIYAVDNNGKADPTPARFMFTAIDKYPPTPVFEYSYWDGETYSVTVAGSPPVATPIPTRIVKSFDDQSIPKTFARDTAAVNSSLHFKWRAQLGVAGSFVAKYCYKLEETLFNCPQPLVDSTVYGPGLTAGSKVFTLRAVDGAGGSRDSTRRIYLNYSPDTWFSGPDPHDPQFTQTRDANGDIYYIDLAGQDLKTWNNGQGIRGTLMSPDSFVILPAARPERRTFFEIWNHRIYAHFADPAHPDTVHMNSWVLFYNGGYDKDSKYTVHIDPTDRHLPWNLPGGGDPGSYPVLLQHPANGSTVGFHSQVVLNMDPKGQPSNFAQTGLYPIYDPVSVFYATNIGGYWPMFFSSKAFALARSEDGDRQTDDKVADPRRLATLVDPPEEGGLGGGTADDIALRQREIISFYVNKAPFFLVSDPTFLPSLDPGNPSVYIGPSWDPSTVNLLADDVDPMSPDETRPDVGKPTVGKLLRYQLTILGKNTDNRDTSFVYDPGGAFSPFFFTPNPPSAIFVPTYLQAGPITFRVQLCDCKDCEKVNGQGRCITKDFSAIYQP